MVMLGLQHRPALTPSQTGGCINLIFAHILYSKPEYLPGGAAW